MFENKEKELEILPINEGKSIEKEFAQMRLVEKINDPEQVYAVHGLMQFDQNEGKLVLKNKTDLDGMGALEILRIAGAIINDQNIIYVKPGDFVAGAINVDTGCKAGFDYCYDNDTVVFDHHADGVGSDTSATMEAYKSLVEMKLIEKNEILDRTVDFVTKIDNRKFEAEEFLRSGKTILGLQRDLDFNKLFLYFSDHEDPCEELSPDEFKKYGLENAAIKQQELVDESMRALEIMETQGKFFESKFGSILINVNNELKAGSSAAYINHDGIINFTPEKSFAVTLKNGQFDQKEIQERLGEKFVGKIIRGNMWIYNDSNELKLSLGEIMNALSQESCLENEKISEMFDGINYPEYCDYLNFSNILKEYIDKRSSKLDYKTRLRLDAIFDGSKYKLNQELAEGYEDLIDETAVVRESERDFFRKFEKARGEYDNFFDKKYYEDGVSILPSEVNGNHKYVDAQKNDLKIIDACLAANSGDKTKDFMRFVVDYNKNQYLYLIDRLSRPKEEVRDLDSYLHFAIECGFYPVRGYNNLVKKGYLPRRYVEE